MFKRKSPMPDEAAFRLIYDEHAEPVRHFLCRMGVRDELDDLVQETFLKIFHAYQDFGARSTLRTWIFSIALNTARDHYRKQKRKSWLAYFNGNEQEIAAPDDLLQALSEQEQVQKALDGLSPKLREVVLLYCLEDWDLQEIADLLHVPLGTVKSRLHQARSKLEQALAEEKLHVS